MLDALMWKAIDPHFTEGRRTSLYARVGSRKSGVLHGPSPIARFPASDQGFRDAIDYANMKIRTEDNA